MLEECYSQALNESIDTLNGLSIDSISEKIMDKAKTKLSEESANFDKSEFIHFRLLFDLIKRIKENHQSLNQPTTSVAVSTQHSQPIEQDPVQTEYYYTKGWLESGVVIEAKGFFMEENEHFTILKDSLMKPDIAPSCPSTVENLRDKLIADDIVEMKNDVYIFKKDYTFSSPSSASGVILGRASNGWKTWKNDKQQTLDEIYHKKLA